jgi:transcriptional/translational regulatory protein YebC/TACO1
MAYFALPADQYAFDDIFEMAVEAGADDIQQDEELIEIFGKPSTFKAIADYLKKAGVKPEESGVKFMPKQEISLDVEKTIKVMKTVENLEELDDVQNVYSNLEITEEAIQAMDKE